MILLDKLSQRGLKRMGMPANPGQPLQPTQPQSPLPSITDTIAQPKARALTTTPMGDRLAALPQRGAMGSMPQWGGTPKRFLADLPANVQLKGISDILSGLDSNSPIVNNFVRGMAAQGKSPEDIRQAFIAQQKTSPNPLVLM